MKRRILLTACLILLTCCTYAQPLQTVYHGNGKKALEGKWTYVPGSYFPATLIGQMTDPEFNGRHPISSVRRGDGDRLELFATLRPEGPVTMWNDAGIKIREWTFKNGLPNGPYRRYYPDGKPEQEGTLANGAPTGEWKRYDQAGALRYTGNYKPFTQEELAARWTAAYGSVTEKRRNGNRDFPAPQTINPFSEHYEIRDRDSFEAIEGLLPPYDHAERLSYSEASRDGKFKLSEKVFTVTGSYKNDLRSGEWAFEHQTTGQKTKLGFDSEGRLAYIVDSTGEKRSVIETVVRYKALRQAAQGAAIAARQQRQASGELDDNAPVFRFVEQMPQFEGDLSAYLSANLKYPPEAKAAGESGRAIVQFHIREDGGISNVEVIRSSGSKTLDAEAVRVVRAMPPWKPGKQQGKAVRVLYTLPITFAQG